MEVIKPIMTRDSAKKLPIPYFTDLTHQVLKVFKCIKHIALHMLTLQVPDAWPDRSAQCTKSDLEHLMICRRHLAHWMLKLKETWDDLENSLKVFIRNLYCHILNDNSASFIVHTLRSEGDIMDYMERFAVNIKERIQTNCSRTGP